MRLNYWGRTVQIRALLCWNTTVGLRLMEVKAVNVVAKNGRVVSYEHPLTIVIV